MVRVRSLWMLAATMVHMAPALAAAGNIRPEAEAFLDSQDGGLDPVTVVSCTQASGGFAVDGVDATGDQIVLGLSLQERFTFRPGIASGGDDTLVRVFEVSLSNAANGETLFADTLTTPPGTGVG